MFVSKRPSWPGLLLVQDVVHEPFTFLVGQPGPVEAALLGERDDLRLKALNGPIEGRCTGDQPENGFASAARRQPVQTFQICLSDGSIGGMFSSFPLSRSSHCSPCIRPPLAWRTPGPRPYVDSHPRRLARSASRMTMTVPRWRGVGRSRRARSRCVPSGEPSGVAILPHAQAIEGPGEQTTGTGRS
jgi:hypothetical protein